MEEGTKNKKTIFVGGLADEADEALIYENFSTFGMSISRYHAMDVYASETGDIIEVQLPSAATNPNQQTGL